MIIHLQQFYVTRLRCKMSRMRVFLLLTFAALSSGQLSWMSDKRIVGGYDTKIERFPHHVAIMTFTPGEIWGELWGDWDYRCGGVLFSTVRGVWSSRYILTAGRCLFKSFDFEGEFNPENKVHDVLPPTAIRVAVGHDWSEFLYQDFKEYFIEVDQVIPHPEIFTCGGKDIGLLRLKKEVKYSYITVRALLPKFNNKPIGLELEFSGFGASSPPTYQLQAGRGLIESDSVCEKLFTGYDRRFHLCIGKAKVLNPYYGVFIKPGVPCDGDEGGGYVTGTGDPPIWTNFKVVGIQSIRSARSCDSSTKSIAMYVPYFIEWINKTICQNGDMNYK